VIALDLPGFGQSEQSGVDRDQYLAQALDDLLPGEKVVIVSPSMSGNFSLPFVARHPKRVAGFVPVAPVGIDTYVGELGRVQVPTLAVWGERDTVVPVAQADVLVSALRGRKLILAGASHACYLDRPDEFHAELLKFLDELRLATR
jgi:pimeloyl-ACP methyl ester carboxylesterase